MELQNENSSGYPPSLLSPHILYMRCLVLRARFCDEFCPVSGLNRISSNSDSRSDMSTWTGEIARRCPDGTCQNCLRTGSQSSYGQLHLEVQHQRLGTDWHSDKPRGCRSGSKCRHVYSENWIWLWNYLMLGRERDRYPKGTLRLHTDPSW